MKSFSNTCDLESISDDIEYVIDEFSGSLALRVMTGIPGAFSSMTLAT